MNKIKLDIGIIGSQTFEKVSDENSTTYRITLTGTSRAFKIPPVLVFCEDKVAEELITHALSYNNINIGSFKFIRCGSWENIITSLAGCILYSQQLIESGSSKKIEAIGILDGDIKESNIREAITNTFTGDFPPQQLEGIRDTIRSHISCFTIPKYILSSKNAKGIPELNLYKMMQEIDSRKIRKVSENRVKELNDFLVKSSEKSQPAIELELSILNKEHDETLKIIEISKRIQFNEENEITDYHTFFKKLRKKTEGIFFQQYNFTNNPVFLVYRIVSKFNAERWEEYIKTVVNFLQSASERQRQNFSSNTFNNINLDK